MAAMREGCKIHRQFTSAKELGFSVLDKIEERYQYYKENTQYSAGSRPCSCLTGIQNVDQCIGTIPLGSLITLASRPGEGKTTFALKIAANMAIRHKRSVLYLSLAESQDMVMMKLIAAHAKVPNSNLLIGDLSDEEWPELIRSLERICSSNLIIEAGYEWGIEDLLHRLHKTQNETLFDLIIIDWVQLLEIKRPSGSKNYDFYQIAKQLKKFAIAIDRPVLALSQIPGNSESRRGGKPRLSDLSQYGALGEISDTVLFIYRNVESSINPNKYKLAVEKNRYGRMGEFMIANRLA